MKIKWWKKAKYYNNKVKANIYKYISKNRAKINLKRNENYLKKKETMASEIKIKQHEAYLRHKAKKLKLKSEIQQTQNSISGD